MWQKVGSTHDVKPGDIVRVVENAYELPELASIHCGRIGVVIGLSGGDVLFRSTDDREPYLPCTYHSPYNLEKKVEQ